MVFLLYLKISVFKSIKLQVVIPLLMTNDMSCANVVESCPCQMSQQQENIIMLCSRGATRPCEYINNTCQV